RRRLLLRGGRRVRESGRRGVTLQRQVELPVQLLLLQGRTLVLAIATSGRREAHRQHDEQSDPTSFPGHDTPPRGEIPRLNGTAFLGKFDAYACPSGTPSYPLRCNLHATSGPFGDRRGLAPRGRVWRRPQGRATRRCGAPRAARARRSPATGRVHGQDSLVP